MQEIPTIGYCYAGNSHNRIPPAKGQSSNLDVGKKEGKVGGGGGGR